MLGTLGRVSVLVSDYDEAIAFYVDRLGFEVRYDGELDDGTRLVHLELPTQPGVGVWLFEAEGEEQRERVGNQTGGAPLAVFYTDDCRGVAGELRERGVEVGEVRESSEDVSVHFEDPYGNRFVLVELAA